MLTVPRIVIPARDVLEETLDGCRVRLTTAVDSARGSVDRRAARAAWATSHIEGLRLVHGGYSLGAEREEMAQRLREWIDILREFANAISAAPLDPNDREDYLAAAWAVSLTQLLDPGSVDDVLALVAGHVDFDFITALRKRGDHANDDSRPRRAYTSLHGPLVVARKAPPPDQLRQLATFLSSYEERMGGYPWAGSDRHPPITNCGIWSFEAAWMMAHRPTVVNNLAGTRSLPADLIERP